MSAEQEYATHIFDLLENFGHCAARRMFGGYGIFHPGLMFGLSADGSLYPKAGGGNALSYFQQERECRLSCFQVLDEFFADSDACRCRARLTFDAALHNPPERKRRKS